MAPYELTLTHVEDDVIETETPSGHTVTFDSKADPGGQGATPIEMLLASIGACSLMDVAMILEKKRLDPGELQVRVVGQRREDHPRAFTHVELVYQATGEVPDKAMEQACQLSVEKYCSVLATVREAPPVDWSFEVG